jgi:hypothetical protein
MIIDMFRLRKLLNMLKYFREVKNLQFLTKKNKKKSKKGSSHRKSSKGRTSKPRTRSLPDRNPDDGISY